MGRNRSVDKQIVANLVAPTANATFASYLFPVGGAAAAPSSVFTGVSFPCTISGVRVQGSVTNASSAAVIPHRWAIMVARQGEALPVHTYSTGTPLAACVAPEEDCMLYGSGITLFDSTGHTAFLRHYDASSSTKRKLMIGDALALTASSPNLAIVVSYYLDIQFFVSI